MSREDKYNEARAELKRMLPDYLQSTGRSLRANFQCPNWSQHKSGDRSPSCSYDRQRNTCHCFTCNSDYDIIDIIGFDYGIEAAADAFKRGYELYNIEIENPTQHTTHNTQPVNREQPEQAELVELKNADFSREIEAAHKELQNYPQAAAYIMSERGISPEIVEQYKLGYAPAGYNSLLTDHKELHCKSSKESLYKYVLPYLDAEGKFNYFQTEITDRSKQDDFNSKYRKISNLRPCPLFNERYIQQADKPTVIYIVEGIYDALSIESAGGKAIALGGIGSRRLIELCRKYKPKSTFIIGLDNESNQNTAKAKKEIEEGLTELGIKWMEPAGMYGTCKDANESLQKDKEQFLMQIKQTTEEAENIIKQEEKNLEEQAAAAREEYRQTFAAGMIDNLQAVIQKNKNQQTISTGFNGLDNVLGGGIYSGLYVIGGISSIGKTSFTLQMADNIAAQGHSVLFFSLETSGYELMSKSLSRISYTEAEKIKKPDKALTTRDILKGRFDNPTRKQLFEAALEIYRKGSGTNLKIIVSPAGEPTSTEQIEEYINEFYNYYNHYPVVVIDYVQLLAPQHERGTDKQNVDYNVLQLKKLSQKMPIICISSFNRESYTAPVGLSSFKESGTIEYSSDILIGLQYEGMDYQMAEKRQKDNSIMETIENETQRSARVRKLIKEQEQKGRDGEPQQVQIKVLKQRLEAKASTPIEFIPKYNLFIDNSEKIIENVWEPITTQQSMFN